MTKLNCPRCAPQTLEELELGPVLIDRCPTCGGMWFDHEEIARALGRDEDEEGTAIEAVVPQQLPDELDRCACPRCPGVVLRRLVLVDAAAGRARLVGRCPSCLGSFVEGFDSQAVDEPEVLDALANRLSTAPA